MPRARVPPRNNDSNALLLGMSHNQFALLQDDSSDASSSSSSSRLATQQQQQDGGGEDASSHRADEVTVLEAVYGEDFERLVSSGEKGGGREQWRVRIRPPPTASTPKAKEEEENRRRTHNNNRNTVADHHLNLVVQLPRHYPHVVPHITIFPDTDTKSNHNVNGGLSLSDAEWAELRTQLDARARDLVAAGSLMMMVELVQVAQDYLQDHAHNSKSNSNNANANNNKLWSAWEQMKAREAAVWRTEREAQVEMERLMKLDEEDPSSRPLEDLSTKSGTMPLEENASRTAAVAATVARIGDGGNDNNRIMVEKELLRQREALLEAARLRRQESTPTGRNESMLLIRSPILAATAPPLARMSDDDDDDDDDEDLYWDANPDPESGLPGGGVLNTSRYLTDFVEMGVLGRGGGGEVVKVRNRLDRRVYAVKKILLESERGRFGKVWALQNRKLRREVTTISRMTHANIVRYYQAWVEGGGVESSTSVDPIVEEENSQEKDNNNNEGEMESDDSSQKDILTADDEDDSSDDDRDWWGNSLGGNGLSLEAQERIAEGNSEDSLFDYGDDEDEALDTAVGPPFRRKEVARSASALVLLEKELDTGVNSPLLSGLGFQNQMYQTMYETKAAPSIENEDDEDDDSIWDESSVKIDSRAGKTILYIQMEFCSTTLRKLIDDRDIEKMNENQKWRLVRQILEALSYLHSRHVIHRYEIVVVEICLNHRMCESSTNRFVVV